MAFTQIQLVAGNIQLCHSANLLSFCDDFRQMTAKQADVPPVQYEVDAIVPGRNWKPSTDIGFQSIPELRRPFVALLDFTRVVNVLWNLNCINRENISRASYLTAFESWYNELLLPEMIDLFGNNLSFEFVGGYCSGPNMDTTTVSIVTGKRIGVHIDTWRGEAWSNRSTTKYRLAVNIGFDKRYFVFCEKTSDEFPVEYSKSTDPLGRPMLGGTKSFRERFEATPLRFYRLQVDPGFAYVAPTEYIFHDGSTLGVDNYTAQVSMRGFFQNAESDSWFGARRRRYEWPATYSNKRSNAGSV